MVCVVVAWLGFTFIWLGGALYLHLFFYMALEAFIMIFLVPLHTHHPLGSYFSLLAMSHRLIERLHSLALSCISSAILTIRLCICCVQAADFSARVIFC